MHFKDFVLESDFEDLDLDFKDLDLDFEDLDLNSDFKDLDFDLEFKVFSLISILNINQNISKTTTPPPSYYTPFDSAFNLHTMVIVFPPA